MGLREPTPAQALPELRTRRLRLVPRTLADLDDCLAMDRQPGVTEQIAGPWDDPRAHRAFIRDRIVRRYPPGQGYWTLRPKSGPDRFLGWVLLIPEDAEGPETEIGWRLPRDAWGQGLAAEAGRALLVHGLDRLGLHRIVSDIRVGHRPSRRVAEKIGLRATETFDQDGHRLVRYLATGPSAETGR